jgi:CheY-like chemotaxis protein
MPCVLIVEDDPDIREFMELLLADAGYDTMTAENGSRALERMRARRPCLVLLDLAMPVMDGWEFRERQLADPELAKVPVVCITAAFDPDSVSARLKLPCLPKPVSFSAVLDEVQNACGRRGA